MLSFKKILLFLLIFLLLVLIVQLFLSRPFSKKVPLVVSFLDVGQGDAILINYQDQYQILIDSGISNKKIMSELSRAMPAQDRFIEVVIATHYDKDHVGGMRAVLENFRVGLFLDNGQFAETDAVTVVTDLLENKNIAHQEVTENSSIEFGEDLVLSFFNPDGLELNANDNSVVARLDFGQNSFLFTGDVGFKTENDLIQDGHNLDVDWLKVAHHGSKNSSGVDFLEKTSPQKA
ncbi:MAG: MBL fold metallo-hydrolase, partial [Candidatus Moranbacteria bacterium]|nr:MBL fold metallo-hydrolase [Candidatus Moranbacteria bacterium]